MGPKDSQLLEPCKLDQMVMLTQISGVFILFGKVTLVAEFEGYFKKLHNCGSRFKLMLNFWFTIFAKVDGFEKFKIVSCSA